MFVSNYSLGSQICIPDIKQQESMRKQGPRQDGCHGCLALVTFCGMSATDARFQQFFLIFSAEFAVW